ncbi:MAG: PAS domain-containing protein [Alphaproteobacteria bacterium]|nr:PAS domain-containing protein [Alphaproteobacteria bacterium]
MLSRRWIHVAAALVLPGAAILIGFALAGEIAWSRALGAVAVLVVLAALVSHRRLASLDGFETHLFGTAAAPLPAAGLSADDYIAALERLEIAAAERAAHEKTRTQAAEAVIDAIPDPLLVIENARQVVLANTAARALFGPAAGRELAAVLRDPALIAAIETAAPGDPAQEVEFALAGAVERIFAGHVVALPETPGAAPRVLVAFADRTAVKRADRVRADFVANVSHELRTPLASLQGFIETLRGPARDDAAARDRFLGIMNDQAMRMGRLVADLLSLSRIEQDEHTPPAERVAVAKILRSVADALLPTARAKAMTIVLESAPDLPPVVGDVDQLTQVFQNLIDNAIKYGRPETPVTVTAKVIARPPGHLRLPAQVVAVSIADRGEGIAREHLPRLTERFYRIDTGRSRALGGTGLGLAIVKHIVNRHRGALLVDSELGRGSTFTVCLAPVGSDPAGAGQPGR